MKLGPYELNKIYCEDCLEALKKLPDKCVDLVITDPPYGINMDKGVGVSSSFGSSPKTVKTYSGQNWDSITPSQQVFDEILRVGKKIIIFGGNFFSDKLPIGTRWLVWDKVGNIKFNNPFSDCELAWTNLKQISTKKYIVIQQGFVAEERRRVHPTQKPVKLFRDILKDYSEEGDIIMDCFMGSGTTAVACKELGRQFLGFELEQKYVDIANKRLQQGNLRKWFG